tara:strand:+ start:219 stop:521 length:303 start_codon:yes stop_codon:yes gene_type:complete
VKFLLVKNPEKREKNTPKEVLRYESQTNIHEFEFTYSCDGYIMGESENCEPYYLFSKIEIFSNRLPYYCNIKVQRVLSNLQPTGRSKCPSNRKIASIRMN